MWDKAGFDYSDEIYIFGDKGQNKDGSVTVPEVLRPYMKGTDIIS